VYGYCAYKKESCSTVCVDNDGDGHYAKSADCPISEGGDDCNDNDPLITTCDCDPGKQEACFPLDKLQNRNRGICTDGIKTCDVNGMWGDCQGAVTPQAEICDKLDNDCNGKIDDTCSCTNGQTQACFSGPAGLAGTGDCRQGQQTCVDNKWGTCFGEVLPVNGSCKDVCKNDPCLCDSCAPGCKNNTGSTTGK
jgi:hypothetical protein